MVSIPFHIDTAQAQTGQTAQNEQPGKLQPRIDGDQSGAVRVARGTVGVARHREQTEKEARER